VLVYFSVLAPLLPPARAFSFSFPPWRCASFRFLFFSGCARGGAFNFFSAGRAALWPVACFVFLGTLFLALVRAPWRRLIFLRFYRAAAACGGRVFGGRAPVFFLVVFFSGGVRWLGAVAFFLRGRFFFLRARFWAPGAKLGPF
jgi:hypothetical protein